MGVWARIASARIGTGIQKSIDEALTRRMAELERQRFLEQQARMQAEQQRQNALLNFLLDLYRGGIQSGVPTEALSGLPGLLSSGMAGQLSPQAVVGAVEQLVPGFQAAREEQERKKRAEEFRRLASALIGEVDPNRVDEYRNAVERCANSDDPFVCFVSVAPQFNLDTRRIEQEAARLGLETQKINVELGKRRVKQADLELKRMGIELEMLPEKLRVEIENMRKQGKLTDEQIAAMAQRRQQEAELFPWKLELEKQNAEYAKLRNQRAALELKILSATSDAEIEKAYKELRQLDERIRAMELDNARRVVQNEREKLGLERDKLGLKWERDALASRALGVVLDLAKEDPRAALAELSRRWDDLVESGVPVAELKKVRDSLERRARITDPDRVDGFNIWKEYANTPPPTSEAERNQKLSSLKALLVQKGYTEQEANELVAIVDLRWRGLLDQRSFEEQLARLRYSKTTGGGTDDIIKAINADRQVLQTRYQALVNEIKTAIAATGAENCIEISWDNLTLKYIDTEGKCGQAIERLRPILERSLPELRSVNDELEKLSRISAELSGRARLGDTQPRGEQAAQPEAGNPDDQANKVIAQVLANFASAGGEYTPEELIDAAYNELSAAGLDEYASQLRSSKEVQDALVAAAQSVGIRVVRHRASKNAPVNKIKQDLQDEVLYPR